MKEWQAVNGGKKPFLPFIESNEIWIYIPREPSEYCCGKFSTISDEIAYRLACKEVFGSAPMFWLYPRLEKLRENPSLDPRLSRKFNKALERYKKKIKDECARKGEFMFNQVWDEEGDLIDYESIEYKPNLDTSLMVCWDEEETLERDRA